MIGNLLYLSVPMTGKAMNLNGMLLLAPLRSTKRAVPQTCLCAEPLGGQLQEAACGLGRRGMSDKNHPENAPQFFIFGELWHQH